MRPSLRLGLCFGIILFSFGYAALVAWNPRIASASALGYIVVLLTIFVAVNVWKKP